MSTTQPETRAKSEVDISPSSEAAERDVSFQTLLCPADGTILEDATQPEPGHYECPTCRRVLPIWEVYQE